MFGMWTIKNILIFIGIFSSKSRTLSPKIVKSLTEQAKLTLTSRAFHNDSLGEYCQFVSNILIIHEYSNTGVEACYSALNRKKMGMK